MRVIRYRSLFGEVTVSQVNLAALIVSSFITGDFLMLSSPVVSRIPDHASSQIETKSVELNIPCKRIAHSGV